MSIIFQTDNKICYKWFASRHIRDFEIPIQSNEFCMKSQPSCSFSLSMQFSENNVGTDSLNVSVNQRSGKIIKASVRMIVENGEAITMDTINWESSCTFHDIARYPPLCSVKQVRIMIKCYITWYGHPDELRPPVSLGLREEIKPFLENSNLSDVTLEIKGKELFAHKLILGAQSPVFLAMFNTNMREKIVNRIIIKDIEFDVMSEVLQYLYTDKIEFGGDFDVFEVLAVAEKYQIMKLKSICEATLFEILSIKNVVTILDEIDKYNLVKLREIVMTFIYENHQEIVALDSFIALGCSKPRLLFEIINFLFEKNAAMAKLLGYQ